MSLILTESGFKCEKVTKSDVMYAISNTQEPDIYEDSFWAWDTDEDTGYKLTTIEDAIESRDTFKTLKKAEERAIDIIDSIEDEEVFVVELDNYYPYNPTGFSKKLPDEYSLVVESYKMNEEDIRFVVDTISKELEYTEAEKHDFEKCIRDNRAEEWYDDIVISYDKSDLKTNKAVKLFLAHCNSEDYDKLEKEFENNLFEESTKQYYVYLDSPAGTELIGRGDKETCERIKAEKDKQWRKGYMWSTRIESKPEKETNYWD